MKYLYNETCEIKHKTYNYQDDNFNNLTKSNTYGFIPYTCIVNIFNAMHLFRH